MAEKVFQCQIYELVFFSRNILFLQEGRSWWGSAFKVLCFHWLWWQRLNLCPQARMRQTHGESHLSQGCLPLPRAWQAPQQGEDQAAAHQFWSPYMLSEPGFSHACRGAFKNFLPLAQSDWQLATGVGGFSSLVRPGNRFYHCSAQHRTAQPVVPSRPAMVTSTLTAQKLHKLFFTSEHNKKWPRLQKEPCQYLRASPPN